MAAQTISITDGVPGAAIQLAAVPGILHVAAAGGLAGGSFRVEISPNSTVANYRPLSLSSDVVTVSQEKGFALPVIAVGWYLRIVNASNVTTGFTATISVE